MCQNIVSHYFVTMLCHIFGSHVTPATHYCVTLLPHYCDTSNLLSDASIEEEPYNSNCDWNKTRRQWSSSLSLLLHYLTFVLHHILHFEKKYKMLICSAKDCNAMLLQYAIISNPTYNVKSLLNLSVLANI